MSFNYNFI